MADEVTNTDDKSSVLHNIYVSIRTWLQPYYRPKPHDAIKSKSKSKSQPNDEKIKIAEQSVNGDKNLTVKVFNSSTPLNKAIKSPNKPIGNRIYCYLDGTVMQVFAHFDIGQAISNGSEKRSNEDRQKLEPMIRVTDRQFDRTHLIPFGYHGSENDNRLLVGWDGNQNKNELNRFEKKVREKINSKMPIYWLTQINKIKGGLQWHYRVWDATNPNEPILKAHLDLDLPCKYVWRGLDK